MAKIVAVHSFRGGTGKSNTSANLAALVAQAGHRVGVIDTDIQSPGIHVIFGFSADQVNFALNDFLWGRAKIEEAAYDVSATAFAGEGTLHPRTKLYLIPSSVNTGEIARVLREGYEVGLLNDGIRRLARELELDYLFIDTHPGINEETLLSIAICDSFLLIMRPDNQDFQGTAVTVELARRLDVRNMMIVVNKVPQGVDMSALRAQIESAYDATVIGLLPLNTEMARLASAGLFAMRFPDHPMAQELKLIAKRLMASVTAGSRDLMAIEDKRNDLESLVTKMRSAAAPFRETLTDVFARCKPLTDGKVADYIPELAKANPDWFAISVVGVDGQVVEVGDFQQMFSIQSISKPFVFGLALEDHGREHVLKKVSVEPTGEAFNSIVLDESTNRPFNPMVNAGAIATADLVKGHDFSERISRMLGMFGRYIGRQAYIDNSIFMSERSTGHRNRAIGHLMLNFGMIEDRVDETLELYFQQCALLVNCHDLAVMGATLAGGGVNPLTGERAIESRFVKDLLSIMLSCGMYDYAGQWAYSVGLPAKSGVGGGIVAVVPGQFGIGVFSPRLDVKGNSVRGVAVCRELSEQFGLHAFESGFIGKSLRDEFRVRRG